MRQLHRSTPGLPQRGDVTTDSYELRLLREPRDARLAAMRRALDAFAALSPTAAVAGCRRRRREARRRAAAASVTQQVHDALLGALRVPVSVQALAAGHPRLPYVAVGACTGPTAGGAGA